MSLQNPVFIPGPTNIPEVIRKACDMPTVDHLSPAFAPILKAALAGCRGVMKAERGEIFIFPSTGTGGWETAISNTLSAGDTVLAARNGMFSDRWIKMCRRFGLEVIQIDVTWGEGIPLPRFAELLHEDKAGRIKAVLATHNETATGVVSDIAGLRRVVDEASHDALLLVDGVSSIGSMPFEFDDWRVDVAVTGSQKGFMLPPGLAITAFSEKALAASRDAKLPRNFFNIDDMRATNVANGYPYTPLVGLLNGLALSSRMLLDEGLDNVFARHARIANGVRAAVAAWGLAPCAAASELYSNSVTAIRVPHGFDPARIVTHAAERYGMAFGAGLGDVAGQVFRIGHLGMLTDAMALSGLAVAEMCMADLGLDIRLGAGVAAAQALYRHGCEQMKAAAD
ncbi:serine--glyoxylate transaminase (plasmid) [Acidiphilium multivorum AIU301]|uniref:Serine--glyoxylate transaminase n=1 Tax=Acidiphilium multivorum (strain DSM 11245 / JCM 8867 / NBRC 100883 / AIU 301) TaxID=926570 RepID=F0J6T4_ACIMA|nr:L-aspartate--glyoxylate aminotransferase BhcA [Acidiphilium multivorum]BAJ82801.1 serine--glyoxylate transaminase [Acidiphilium multivorum AIU301]GAN74624.1 serine--glyoxylate transaminase [Acidiphilium multivorum AIU301]